MGAVANQSDAGLGVAATDAFAGAVDHPPPTALQLDALRDAIDSPSIIVARIAAWAACVLAALDKESGERLLHDWSTLAAQGRWAVLFAFKAATPASTELLRLLVGLALDDRADSIRECAAAKASAHRLVEHLPRIRQLAAVEGVGGQGCAYERHVKILEHGWCFEPDAIGDSAGTMWVSARGEGATGFTVPDASIRALGVEMIGSLARVAIDDPGALREFTDLLFSGRYEELRKLLRPQ